VSRAIDAASHAGDHRQPRRSEAGGELARERPRRFTGAALGYSSLRLESFLFTQEAFQDIKARLKPGGVFAMYNFYRQGWVVTRLAKMSEQVFGSKPLVASLPYLQTIAPATHNKNTSRLFSPDQPPPFSGQCNRMGFSGCTSNRSSIAV
jgi:hypothetical protein